MKRTSPRAASWSSPGRRWALAPALLVLLAACAEPPCPDDCPTGQRCDTELGRCVIVVSGCSVTGCGDDEQCNPLSGRCEPLPDCLIEGCTVGQTCNSRSRRCEVGPGCVLAGCPYDEICDLEQGTCVAQPCSRDQDCPAGTVCGDQARCTRGCRADRACRAGSICQLGGDDGGAGRCVEGCLADTDCAWGQRCQVELAPGSSAGAGSCRAEPPCAGSADCRPDERCERGGCRQGPCTEGVPCAATEFCDADTGDCREASCDDDPFEENDTLAGAAPLRLQAYSHLMLCAGDVDLYRLHVERGEELAVALRFAPGADLDLRLLDAQGRSLASSAGVGTEERVAHAATEAGELYVEVAGFRNAQAAYTLALQTGPATCPEDRLAPNQRFDEASTQGFQTPAAESLRLCPASPDWFRFEASAGDGLVVTLSADNLGAGGPRLELTLFEAGGAVLQQRGEAGAGTLRLELPSLRQSGTQRVRVAAEGLAAAGVRYQLQTRLAQGGLYCAEDSFEPNDRVDEAVRLEPSRYTELRSCPDDHDWFFIDLPLAEAALTVTLLPLSSPGQVTPPLPDLLLLRPGDLAELARGLPHDGGLRLDFGPGEPSGEYLLGVVPSPASATALSYELQLERQVPPPCRDDGLERAGNDVLELASPLSGGLHDGLRLCPASRRDVYRLATQAGQSVRVRLRPLADSATSGESTGLDATAPEFTLSLLDGGDGQPLAQGTAVGGAGGLDAWLPSAGVEGILISVGVQGRGASFPYAGVGYRLAVETIP